ncbi:MAG: hypothetical protein LBU13_10290 [Synergistaceae bacterium]|jgi:hypothetical protein|nr:hypothetical protein [Synergistaceae bacterium]
MGQIFNACVYDIDSMVCYQSDVDKFHANCYSFSGDVAVTHYLLRQKAYRVMWGGWYVLEDIANFSREEDLLGLSTYIDCEDIEYNNDDLKEETEEAEETEETKEKKEAKEKEEKDRLDKAKFIGDNYSRWKRINVWNEALEYFNMHNTHSVKYNGYLLNHTQKLAVNLGDYFVRSMFWTEEKKLAVVDPVPVLTETGGGSRMAFFEGIAEDSTDQLFGKWCGDLLQIVDQVPGEYELIDCCFVEIWNRAKFCYSLYGVDESNYILGDWDGNRYKCALYNFLEKRSRARYVKVELTEDKIRYTTELPPKLEDAPETSGEKDE